MALANWARVTTTTTGTGNLTLSAVTGYPTLNDVVGTNRRFHYAILLDSDGTPIEEGIGYLSASTTLVRERVTATYASSTYDDTSPSAVSLAAGTYRVISSGGADAIQGAALNVNRNASLALQKVVHSEHLLFGQSSSTGYTMVANRLVIVPFKLGTRVECDALCLRVGTGVAATNVRMGIWDEQADGHPGRLLGETGALASTTSGSDVIGTIGSVITLQPGRYFTGVVSDGAPAVGRAAQSGELYAFLGPAAGNLMQGVAAFYSTHTFGALPNPAPSTSLTAINASTSYPAIGLRCV